LIDYLKQLHYTLYSLNILLSLYEISFKGRELSMDENSNSGTKQTNNKMTSLNNFSSSDDSTELVKLSTDDFKWEDAKNDKNLWENLLATREFIRDPLHGDIEITLLEKSIIDLEIFQRMRGISQLGPTQLVYPGAVHNRFLHSIGTLHVAEQLISILNKNYNTLCNNVNLKKYAQEITLYDHFLIRVTALVHDLAHVPFGHTLEDEGKLFKPEWEDAARLKFFEKTDSTRKNENLEKTLIGKLHDFCEELKISKHKEADGKTELKEFVNLIEILNEYGISIELLEEKQQDVTVFDAIEQVFIKFQRPDAKHITNRICDDVKQILIMKEPKDKNLLFIKDIVSKNICADLLDYSQRDMYFCGLSEKWGERFIKYLAILKVSDTESKFKELKHKEQKLEHNEYWLDEEGNGRIVLLAYRCEQEFERPTETTSVPKMDVISEAIDLLRKRYTLGEKVYFHRTKLAASSMLISAVGNSKLSTEKLINWNEQQLITQLMLSDLRTRNLIKAYCQRNLYKTIYQISFKNESEESTKIRHFWDQTYMFYREPQNRLEAEIHLEEAFNLNPGSVSIYCPDKKMNLKRFKALVHTAADQEKIKHLSDILDSNRKAEMKVIEDKFELLWKLQVFVDPKQLNPKDKGNLKRAEFIKECEYLFEFSNENALNGSSDPREILYIKKNELVISKAILKWNYSNPEMHVTLPMKDQIFVDCCKRYSSEQNTFESIYKDIEDKAKSYYAKIKRD
jgi:HD superfamily phosphohydrolase